MPDIKNHIRVFSQEIVPHIAGTDAEYYASTMIAKSFKRHELETLMQEFSVSVYTPLAFGALALLAGVLSLLSRMHVALAVLALLLAAIFAVLWVAELVGHPILSLYLPLVSSQNIIARHNAQLISPQTEGEEDDEEAEALSLRASNGRLGRKVVVIANYDTPKQDVTYHPIIAPYRHFLSLGLTVCIIALPILLLTQFLNAETSVLRPIGYVLIVIVALYLLLYGIAQLVNHLVMHGVRGANDNASGIAVLLGLANRVRPMYRDGKLVEDYDEFDGEDFNDFDEVIAEFEAAREPEQAEEPQDEEMPEFVRRGLPVAQQLKMFGDETTIEFVSAEEMMRLTQALPEAPSVAKSSVMPGFLQPVEEGVGEVMPRTSTDPQATVALSAEQIERARQLIDEDAVMQADQTDDTVVSAPVQGDENMHGEQKAQASHIEGQDMPRHFAGNHAANDTEHESQEDEKENLTPQERRAKEMREAEARILEQQRARRLSREHAAHVALTTPQEAEAALMHKHADQHPVDAPEAWGEAEFRPHEFAPLRDIPDPSISAINPFSADEIQVVGDVDDMPASIPHHQPEEKPVFDVIGAPEPKSDDQSDAQESILQRLSDKFSGLLKRGEASDDQPRRRFRRKPRKEEESMSEWLDLDDDFEAKQSGRNIGSWDNFDKTASIKRIDPATAQTKDGWQNSTSEWRGGAARGDGEALTDEDLDQAAELVLGLGDPELVGHDIWFVALGSSEYGHAGMENFLREYRSQLRNALFINVKGVGAGDLTLRVREGKLGYRVSDRRLGSIIAKTGKQIHHSVEIIRQPWVETDLTPALKAGLRGVTITGLNKGAVAHSHWSTDTLDRVNTSQVKAVIEMVCQAIRQS